MYIRTESAANQLYTHLDEQNKPKEEDAELEPPVDQLYAQVDKKGKKKSKEKEVCAEESVAVYSVVNKPSPPQLPAKSQQLMEELYIS